MGEEFLEGRGGCGSWAAGGGDGGYWTEDSEAFDSKVSERERAAIVARFAPPAKARQGPPRPAQPSPGFVTLCRNAAKNSASVKPSTSR